MHHHTPLHVCPLQTLRAVLCHPPCLHPKVCTPTQAIVLFQDHIIVSACLVLPSSTSQWPWHAVPCLTLQTQVTLHHITAAFQASCILVHSLHATKLSTWLAASKRLQAGQGCKPTSMPVKQGCLVFQASLVPKPKQQPSQNARSRHANASWTRQALPLQPNQRPHRTGLLSQQV